MSQPDIRSVRDEQVDALARFICAKMHGESSCDRLTFTSLPEVIGGCYAVPPPESQFAMWRRYRPLAEAILEHLSL